ncbi:MAG: hypothetical protein ABIB43_06660 [archaeon]
MRGNLESIITDKLAEYPKTIGIATGLLSLAAFQGIDYAFAEYLNQDLPRLWNVTMSLFSAGLGYMAYQAQLTNQAFKWLGLNYNKLKEKLTVKTETKKSGKILDELFENPGASATMATMLLEVARNGYKIMDHGVDRWLNHWNNPSSLPVEIAAIGLFFGLTYSFFSGVGYELFHSSNRKHLNQGLKFWMKSKFKNKEKLIEEYGSIVRENPLVDMTYDYAELCMKLGRKHEALDVLKDVYEKRRTDDILPKGKSLTNFRWNISKFYKGINTHPEIYDNYLGLAMACVNINETDKALEIIHNFTLQAERNDELALNANINELIFIDNFGTQEQLEKQAAKLVKRAKLERITLGHEFYIMTDNEFSQHSLGFRRSLTEEFLLSETKFNSEIKKNFDAVNDNLKWRVMEPPKTIHPDGLLFNLMRLEAGINGHQYFARKEDIGMRKQLARLSGRIHGANPIYEPMSEEYYLKQLTDRMDVEKYPDYSEQIKKLNDNIPVLFRNSGTQPRVVNIDNQQENFIIGWYLSKADNQYHEPTLAAMECSKQLEQGRALPFTKEGDEWRKEILKEYHTEFKQFHNIISLEEFIVLKLQSDPIKALSYFFFSRPYPGRHKLANSFLYSSIHSMMNVENYYESQHDRKSIQIVRDVSSGLLS